MTDDELKALCESNARSCEANSSAIADLGRGMVRFSEESAAFRNELRSWVSVHNQISDDQGAELADLRTGSNLHDAQVTALRDAANADRQAFVEAMEADRAAALARADADRQEFRMAMEADRAKTEADSQAFRAALAEDRAKAEADRAEWQAGFQAQMEVIQRMLLEIRSTNGALSGLSDRVDNLEQAS